MAHQFPLDPAGRVLLWSRSGREATLVAPSYPIYFIKKKKKLHQSHLMENAYEDVLILRKLSVIWINALNKIMIHT
jgi:hypothetical protein